MLNRLVLLVLVLFWGAMTWLLWRSEYGSRDRAGGQVPVAKIWERILTAPDDSSLEIRRRDKRIGTCRWSANVAEAVATGRASSLASLEQDPGGRVLKISNYTLDLEGNVAPSPGERPYRYNLHVDVTTNHVWRSFEAQVTQRPNSWSLAAFNESQTVKVKVNEGDESWEHSFSFDELERPEKLLSDFGLSWLAPMLSGVIGSQSFSTNSPASMLKWEARQDWFELGKSRTRAYRLSARLFNKFGAVIFLGRSGEILRIELPDGIVALNDGFTSF